MVEQAIHEGTVVKERAVVGTKTLVLEFTYWRLPRILGLEDDIQSMSIKELLARLGLDACGSKMCRQQFRLNDAVRFARIGRTRPHVKIVHDSCTGKHGVRHILPFAVELHSMLGLEEFLDRVAISSC